MSLSDELLAQRRRSTERYGPEGMAVIDGAIESLHSSGDAEGLSTGERAPLFTLPAARGGEISLGDLRGRRAVVLAFYRGGW